VRPPCEEMDIRRAGHPATLPNGKRVSERAVKTLVRDHGG
jgi:hypothetical protein